MTTFVRRLETAVQYVADLDASVAWYQRLLEQAPTPYEGPYFPFPDGGYIILHPATNGTGRGGTGVWFSVDSVDDIYRRKTAQGFEFNEEPFDIPPGRLVTLDDPDGNIVGFIDNRAGGMPPGPQRTGEPDAVVRQLYEQFMNAGDRTAAERLIGDDFIDHSNPATGASGKPELIDLVLSARVADPSLVSRVTSARSSGDLAMVTIESTIAGIDWRELHVYRVLDGQIRERWGLRTRADRPQQ